MKANILLDGGGRISVPVKSEVDFHNLVKEISNEICWYEVSDNCWLDTGKVAYIELDK